MIELTIRQCSRSGIPWSVSWPCVGSCLQKPVMCWDLLQGNKGRSTIRYNQASSWKNKIQCLITDTIRELHNYGEKYEISSVGFMAGWEYKIRRHLSKHERKLSILTVWWTPFFWNYSHQKTMKLWKYCLQYSCNHLHVFMMSLCWNFS